MSFVSVNGVNLYYEIHGPENAPLLVLNNGIIMNAATSWAFQTKILSKRYRVLQYDCRGQGQSDHPKEKYSMEGHADDLAALLEFLDIDKAHIAGISYGGEVAQAFALNFPEKTLSLILVDTVSEVGPELKFIIDSWIDVARMADPDLFFKITVPWNFSAKFIRENPILLEDAKKRYTDFDYPAIIRLCEAFMDVDFTEKLGQIDMPTCILVGDQDILKGTNYAEILKKHIPHSEYHVISDSGHASCWEQPKKFNQIIHNFLDNHSV